MKQIYETVMIFDGTLPDETIQKESAKLEEFIKLNAEFDHIDVWGKRQLAYTINKKKTGFYQIFYFKADSESNIAAKIVKFLKLNETVIRHLTVVQEIIPVPVVRIRPESSNENEEGDISNDE